MLPRNFVHAARLAPAVMILASVARAATPSFVGIEAPVTSQPIISSAFAVSGDGMVVTGMGMFAGNVPLPYRWTRAQGMASLGTGISVGEGTGLSLDGSVVVGLKTAAGVSEAFRWSSAGMVGLGHLLVGSTSSGANSVSRDGNVIVGFGNSPSGQEAFALTPGGGMVGLGDLPGGTFQSYAAKVSGNGSVVVGYSNSANGTEAFRLTLGGSMIPLGDLPGGTFASIAQAVNADGSVIAGSSATADGYEAFVWDSVNGMRSLGDLPGGAVQGAAADVSADGAIIVGGSISAAGDRAFIWDSTHHMRDLQDVLVNECGLNLSGWSLNGADGISDDGLTIVGIGVNPQGKLEGWIAVLPEPANAAILLPCLLGFSGLRRRRTR